MDKSLIATVVALIAVCGLTAQASDALGPVLTRTMGTHSRAKSNKKHKEAVAIEEKTTSPEAASSSDARGKEKTKRPGPDAASAATEHQ